MVGRGIFKEAAAFRNVLLEASLVKQSVLKRLVKGAGFILKKRNKNKSVKTHTCVGAARRPFTHSMVYIRHKPCILQFIQEAEALNDAILFINFGYNLL